MNFNISFVEKLRWRYHLLQHKYQQHRRCSNETAVVKTEYGKVKGVKRLTIYDEFYYSFEGIPYAQPPVGELRFKAPQRPTPWTGIRDCSNSKEKAMQLALINKIEGSEDCLYLNIYTNNLTPDSARPVMVWIHGGGFMSGEANREWYGPDYFMRKDVVLVTIQYRLGVLGFLSLETPSLNVPGNAGLKDQVMALKWIKNNCASFGGNADCITVFGESAGGASTHYMMLTEQTQGLFHRGITMSGNAIAFWANTEAQKRAYTIAKLAGYKGDSTEKNILDFLLNVKAKDLLLAEEKVLTSEERKQRIMCAFGPTVEPYSTPECVVSKQPREMMMSAWGNSIPLMLGATSYEGLFLLPEVRQMPIVLKDMNSCSSFVPHELAATEDTNDLGLKIKQAHVTGESPSPDNFMDLVSVMYSWFPLHRLVLSRFAHAASAPMFLYRYDFDSEELINPYRIMRWGRGIKGVSHADELTYLFSSMLAHRMPKESREYRNIERTVDIWTKFAETGNPNDEKTNGMETMSWEPLNKSDAIHKCLNISDELRFIDLPEMQKIKVWESLYRRTPELLY